MNIYRNKKKLLNNMKYEIYKNLYNDVIKKISMYADNLDNFCIIEIPIFQFGKLAYDINEAINYIIYNLNNEIKNNNLQEVKKYETNILYISWKLD